MGKFLDLLKKGIVNINNNTSRSVVINTGNGKTTIKLNGKKIDPKSPEGKKILKETNKEMDRLEKTMTNMAKELEEAFEGFGDNFGEGME